MNEEIYGGLRSALSRGESLQNAMMTLFNAGYKKEEIEEAAKVVQNPRAIVSPHPSVSTQSKTKKINPIPKTKKILPSQTSKISNYGVQNKKKSKVVGKGFIVTLMILALIFVGLLIAFLISR